MVAPTDNGLHDDSIIILSHLYQKLLKTSDDILNANAL